jgi:hypothetical protein
VEYICRIHFSAKRLNPGEQMKRYPNMSFTTSSLAVLALAGAAILATAPSVRADDCQKRTERADHHLHEAIAKHGPESPEAEKYRHELADARAYCWDHSKRWWDEDGHRWHTDHDWDDHDHH